jgi:putative DNA primase/helicase
LGPWIKRGAWAQRDWLDALLIPIYGADGNIWSIEAINPDGKKDFLAGSKTGGGFHPFGEIRDAPKLLIGEGVASVAVCASATGLPAIAALSAGNLRSVAQAVRELAPNAAIIVVADNDVKPDGDNTGVTAATDAARAVGGYVAVPELNGRKCDLWDLWAEFGSEAVRVYPQQRQRSRESFRRFSRYPKLAGAPVRLGLSWFSGRYRSHHCAAQ